MKKNSSLWDNHPKYNLLLIDALKSAFQGQIVGTLGDFFKGEKIRSLYEPVLNVEIMRFDKPVEKGQKINMSKGVVFKGAFGTFENRPMVFISPNHPDIIRTILEEAAHAMRANLGRINKERDDLENFDQEKHDSLEQEISAEKIAEYAAQLKEEEDIFSNKNNWYKHAIQTEWSGGEWKYKENEQPVFKSTLITLLEQKDGHIYPQRYAQSGMQAFEWLKRLTSKYAVRNGVREEELIWTGLIDKLESNPTTKYTDSEIINYLQENQVQIKDFIPGKIPEIELNFGEASVIEPDWNEESEGYLDDAKELLISENEDFNEETDEIDEDDILAKAEEMAYENYEYDYEYSESEYGYSIIKYSNDTFNVLDPDQIFIGEFPSLTLAEDAANEHANENMINDNGPEDYRWSDYVIPGGKNYQELVLTIPSHKGEKYYSNVHWDNEKYGTPENVFVHMRFNDRTESVKPNIETIKNTQQKQKEIQQQKEKLELIVKNFKKDKEEKGFGNGSQELLNWQKIYNKEKSKKDELDSKYNELTIEKTQDVLFIEEIQSDWHQEGRDLGYAIEKNFTPKPKMITELPKELKVEKVKSKDYGVKQDTYIIKIIDYTNPIVTNIAQNYLYQYSETPEEAIKSFLLGYNEDLLKQWQNENNIGVPDAPFKEASEWGEVALSRMLRYAIDEDYEKIQWTTGKSQFDRWGSQSVRWERRILEGKPVNLWDIVVAPQVSGETAGINLEELARQHYGQNKKIEGISSFEELMKAVSNGSRGESEKKIKKISEKVWERMKKENSGEYLPRKEGMEFFYDVVLPSVANRLYSKYNGEDQEYSLDQYENPKGKVNKKERNKIDRLPLPANSEIISEQTTGGYWRSFCFDKKRRHNEPFSKYYTSNLYKTKEESIQEVIDALSPEVHVLEITDKMKKNMKGKSLPIFSNKNNWYKIAQDYDPEKDAQDYFYIGHLPEKEIDVIDKKEEFIWRFNQETGEIETAPNTNKHSLLWGDEVAKQWRGRAGYDERTVFGGYGEFVISVLPPDNLVEKYNDDIFTQYRENKPPRYMKIPNKIINEIRKLWPEDRIEGFAGVWANNNNWYKTSQSVFEKLFRGESNFSKKNGQYWSPSLDFAIQFTQSGKRSELLQCQIKTSDILDMEQNMPYGGDPDSIDEAVNFAKSKGYKAIRLDEGINQPQSVFIFDNSAIKSISKVVEANNNNWYKVARYGGAEQERQIFYHGTRGSLLPTILSQGLIPDPKERELNYLKMKKYIKFLLGKK